METYVPDGARDWALVRISVSETGWDEVFQRAQTLPMLAPRQVIIVEGVESLEKLGDKSRDIVLEDLNKYLDSPAPFTVLLLEATALDRRQKLYKVLDDKALIVELTMGGESAACACFSNGKRLGCGD